MACGESRPRESSRSGAYWLYGGLQAATMVEEGRQRMRREVIATSEQPDLDGGPVADPDVIATIMQLPPYLQPMMT